MSVSSVSVHTLRRLWKPIKQRLGGLEDFSETLVRFHRSISWLARAEDLRESGPDDDRLLCLWISFNGLYGCWNLKKAEPEPDVQSIARFQKLLFQRDKAGYIGGMLQDTRDTVMWILDSKHLNAWFWQAEPTAARSAQARKARFDARTWYATENWPMLFARVIERVYLLRCQLVHGAATHSSRLNRVALGHCCAWMDQCLPAVLMVFIDNATQADWGPICYPPLDE